MEQKNIYEIIKRCYKDIIELDKQDLVKYIEGRINGIDDLTIIELEKELIKIFFKLPHLNFEKFYLDVINHAHLEIQRVLNENDNSHKVNICVENEYAKEFLIRVEERMMFLNKGFSPVDIEEYLVIKYRLPTFMSEDKVATNFYKRLIKANYKIITELTNLEIINQKGRPKMFDELKSIKKQVHTAKMKEYMKSKYNTYSIVNNNLLTTEEYKEIEKCNLSDAIKNKIKMLTKTFIKKE